MGSYDALPEAVLVLDRDRRVVGRNDRAAQLLGVTDEDLGERFGDVVDLLDATGVPCPDPLPERGVGDRVAELALQVRLAGGRTRPVAVAGRWQPDGGIVLTFRSARRRVTQEAAAGDLVATVGHELRAPLASVRGFTRTLLEHWDRYGDDQKQTMLATIAEDAERVGRLLVDLLASARIDADRVEVRPSGTDVAALARAVVDKARHRPEGEGRELVVAVATGVPPLVHADTDKVERMLTNLVDNALRHAPGAVVHVDVGPGADGGVRVSVRDDGPGIPVEEQGRVFQRLERGRDTRAVGTGLGLHITRGLARAHGGDLVLDSAAGEGATFVLTLPAGTPPG